ncbi:two-component system histidine kinase PnpS [Oceanirhabdus sp. W0125-5]|uniref:two-component system histidine kinase PnpS n=1 Tax=Oceanirhabdus sp. W0125-5 TaxID=2999116 RepID=UPI0022F2CF0C|nr:ATP-binding protein [Oceanirhabdus sp. W0125-5]WBW99630.1 ATP-binding protein [Oceanirhabdus sp. W0125-5]
MKKKLMIYILGFFTLFLITLTILFSSIFNRQYEENVKNNLKTNSKLIINSLENDPNMHFQHYTNEEEDLRITIINEDGKVIQDTHADEELLDNHIMREEIQQARESGEGYSIRYSNSLNTSMVYYAVKYKNKYIRTALPIHYVNMFSGKYFAYYLYSVVIIFLVSIWFSNKIAYVIVKPIKNLEVTTERIAKGDLTRRVQVTSDDEIGKLGKSFNKMAMQLESMIKEVTDKQNRLEAILGSMDSGLLALDRNRNIIMINSFAKSMFKIKGDVIGERLDKCIDNQELAKLFSTDIQEYVEITIDTNERRYFRVKTADIINVNDHIGTVAVLQDITDIKRLEKMRTQFVANVSHELKTPLTSIKGFAETLKDVDDVETKNKFLDIINTEAERLTRLINDILTLSHIEQQTEMVNESVYVNEIIDDVYNLIKSTKKGKERDIRMELQSVAPLWGDSDKFKQMLINLVDNAVKYSESGDKIYIRSYYDKGSCIIEVEDTGVGISEHKIPRLFERFYRVDKARSRETGGTGLGLAIVKHIVIAFNGKINVESQKGVGTKFIVSIPYKKKK